jgi:hypothetical protein
MGDDKLTPSLDANATRRRINDVLGDCNEFFSKVVSHLRELNVDVAGLPMSHLGYKAATVEEYAQVRDGLLPLSASIVENVHNGRPISKIILSEPVLLGAGFEVSMMEIMPPKKLPGAGYRPRARRVCGGGLTGRLRGTPQGCGNGYPGPGAVLPAGIRRVCRWAAGQVLQVLAQESSRA